MIKIAVTGYTGRMGSEAVRLVLNDENYELVGVLGHRHQHQNINEIDALRWLLQEDYVSVQVILPKQTSYTHEKLHDPQMVILETKSGIHIDLEVFVNCQFGYDIKCVVVCETGEISLEDPSYTRVKAKGKDYTTVSPDWQSRFMDAYDEEFQLWIHSIQADAITGPTAWDGYVASITMVACGVARESGERVAISLDSCPTLYQA